MAENTTSQHDIEEHQASYKAFVKGSIVVVLASAFTLVALSAFAFGKSLSILLGWADLIFGLIAIFIDLRSGSKAWPVSLATLVLFGLFTAVNVS